MKYKLLLFTLVLSLSLSAQKKKNGNIYIDHPAIQVIEDLYSAMNANDTIALSKILADNYRGISGSQMNKDAEPQTKSEFIQQVYNANTIILEKLKVVILMQLNIKMKIFRVSLGYTAGSISQQLVELPVLIIHIQDTLSMS